jgi:hypothetical protein
MKHVEASELLNAIAVPMTRTQKLQRWADLIRQSHRQLQLFSGLEYMRADQREHYLIAPTDPTALGIAVNDPEFQAQGLTPGVSLNAALRFFELSVSQAHAFSCDCGGTISNMEQAKRIERA